MCKHVWAHKIDGWFYCIHCLKHVFVHLKRDGNNDQWYTLIECSEHRKVKKNG